MAEAAEEMVEARSSRGAEEVSSDAIIAEASGRREDRSGMAEALG